MRRLLGLKIACRYLFSKKTHNAVNIITGVAVCTTAIATAAIVIVLSVFNGFREIALSRFSKFEAPVRIDSADGEAFFADSLAEALADMPSIGTMSPLVETKAFVSTEASNATLRLVGVAENYLSVSSIDEVIIDGAPFVGDTLEVTWGAVGAGVAHRLGIRAGSEKNVHIMMPKRYGYINPGSLLSSFRADSMRVSGVFRVDDQAIDQSVVLAPIDMVADLTGVEEGYAHALNVYPVDGFSLERLQSRIAPSGLRALDIEHQNLDAFRMIRIEKWISFALLAFILIIASFNIISTLTMLIIEKRSNMSVLKAMGLPDRGIRSIFVWEGCLLSVFGGLAGCVIGALLVLGQKTFGWVRITADIDPSLLTVTSYPVGFSWSDIFVVLGLVIILSVITTLIGLLGFSTRNEKI